jgi:MoxR-like ATPase
MAHGPDAVHELIEESGWSYPVSVRRLEREHALANVRLDDRDNYIMLGELLADVEGDRFESRDDLQRKMEPVVEERRRARRTGVLARLVDAIRGR